MIIGNGVSSIGNEAFCWCTRLTNVTIGNRVSYIGYSAFDDCSRLTNVYYNGTKEQWNAIDIEGYGNDSLINADIMTAKYFISFDADSATFTLINQTDNAVKVRFVVVAYDKEGRMVAGNTGVYALNGSGTVEQNLVYPAGAEVYRVKAFVLSPDTLQPLCNARTWKL